MGSLKRWVTTFILAILILAVLYLGMRAVASLRQGYSWSEMDWDQKGKTTFIDFLRASDIGKREIEQDGKKCIEYYAYKDGLPVKIVCS